MHESALSRAALPAPTVCLGMLLHPYSLGHELWLLREQNDLLRLPPPQSHQASPELTTPSPAMLLALPAAVLICCQSWTELAVMRRDWTLGLKLWLWRRRTRSMDHVAEVHKFARYRDDGLLELPLSQILKPDKTAPARLPGAPFVLRLQQWLMGQFGLSEAEAWDYPAGLAKMRWAAHWEQEGCLDVYNAHDAEFDAFVADQEAKEACLPVPTACPNS